MATKCPIVYPQAFETLANCFSNILPKVYMLERIFWNRRPHKVGQWATTDYQKRFLNSLLIERPVEPEVNAAVVI